MHTLILRAAQREELLRQAVRGYPHEICGFVGGTRRGGQLYAEQILAVPNAADTPRTRFRMARQAMVGAIYRLNDAGLEVVAIYHSHPDSVPEPSAHDIAECSWPDAAYLIIGQVATAPTLKVWRIRQQQAEPISLVVLP